MQIYIHHNNQQIGPFTEAEIKAQLAAGAISPQDHVWWQGQQDWVPLSQSFLVTGAVTATTPPVPTAPYLSAPAKGKTSGLAIASLVCGLAGLFCGLLSIAAIICGHMSRSEIKKNPSLQGGGLALSGLILGYVWLPIYISIVSISVLIALGDQVKSTFKTITTETEQSTNSADQSATNSDQTTNAPDQNTPTATPTNSPDQSTNSAPANTNAPDRSTNSANPSTNSSPSSTNAPDSSPTNAAPMTQ